MVNQTTLPIESEYPERTVLADEGSGWHVELAEYDPPIYPDSHRVMDLLIEQGIGIGSEQTLRRLAGLSTPQAVELVGPAIAKVRNPLGRTGINGTGAYWVAGESATADMAVLREADEGAWEVALVFSRRWGLIGGFCDSDEERANRQLAQLRETEEEAGLDLTELLQRDFVKEIIPIHVKPSSRRSVDYGYVTNHLSGVFLPVDFDQELKVRPGSDAKKVGWFHLDEVVLMHERGEISVDHFNYIKAAEQYYWPS